MLYRPGHPTASKAGYIAEHRLIMEKHLGRLLNKWEVVHHVDGNKANNALENLQLMTKMRHDSEILKGRQYLVICPHCGERFPIRTNARYVAE
jgi:hypothetical protein